MRTAKWILPAFIVMCLSQIVTGQAFDHTDYDADGIYRRRGCLFKSAARGVGYDTMSVVDPITGEESMVTRPASPVPEFMNSKKIYKLNEVTTPPQAIIGTHPLEEYLLDNLKEVIRDCQIDSFTIKLDLRNIIADENGRIVYYELGGVKGRGTDKTIRTLNRGELAVKIEALMSNAQSMKPAVLNGKNVPAYTGTTLDYYEIDIRKPIVTYRKTDRKGFGITHYRMAK